MLILSRLVGERILIGDNVEVEVIEAGYGKVRLGITAPRDVKVLRKELLGTGYTAPALRPGRPTVDRLPGDSAGEMGVVD